MKIPSRTKGIGAGRRGGAKRPAGENPFAAFERGRTPEADRDPERGFAPATELEFDLDTDAEADSDLDEDDGFDADADADPDPDPVRGAAPAAGREGAAKSRRPERGPRERLRRLLVLSLLFFLFMPAMPVLLLRFLPPVASTMMMKRWVDAHVEGRDFDLQYDWVSRDAIAPSLRRAVVASEDQRFYDHAGFDWKELQNALDEWRDGGSLRGASTISQQVAKNLFLWPGRSFLRKVFEAWFTLWIEWLWPKERILEVYLNIAELGDGVFGAEAASRRYFKHPAAKLVPHEAALLAAMLPSPLRFNPANPSAYLRQRQKWILRQL